MSDIVPKTVPFPCFLKMYGLAAGAAKQGFMDAGLHFGKYKKKAAPGGSRFPIGISGKA